MTITSCVGARRATAFICPLRERSTSALGREARNTVGVCSCTEFSPEQWIRRLCHPSAHRGVCSESVFTFLTALLFYWNRPVGKGRYIFLNGDFYDGEFCKNKAHGVGVYYHTNGNIFSGQWVSAEVACLLCISHFYRWNA